MRQSEKMEPVGHDKRFDSPEPRPREEWEMWRLISCQYDADMFKYFSLFFLVVILKSCDIFSIIAYKIYKIYI